MTKRLGTVVNCPKCKNDIDPLIVKFDPGNLDVGGSIPDRNMLMCPVSSCKIVFYMAVK